MRPLSISHLGFLFTCSLAACSADDGNADPDPEEGDLPAGSTALVVIANPVPNVGHATAVPSILGTQRTGVFIDADPGGEGTTNDTGLAVVEARPGATSLWLGPADGDARPELEIAVQAEGDVYDTPLAYDGTGAELFANTPSRYPVGEVSGAVFIEAGTVITDIERELDRDGVVVVLRPGVYEGDLTIRGEGVLLFGEGYSESAVTIDGSIDARGERVRLRGLTITGNVTSAGDGFGMSFSIVHGEARITGDGGAFLRNAFCGDTVVPSDSATLLDNLGLAPLEDPSNAPCEPLEQDG